MSTDATFWNKIAEDYSRKPVDNPEAFERKIAITTSRMKPDDVVLDIGCGTGSLALRLAAHAGQIHGLDISSEMIRIAKDKASAEGVDNVHFHVGPFDESAPFEAESLDGLCAYSILHLVADRGAALAQIWRLLQPGGFFISSTVCLRESWAPMGLMIRVMRLFGKAPSVVGSVSRQTLVDEIRAAGFVDIEQPEVGAQSMVAFVVATKPN